MAPTFCKDCSIKISGFFKRKFTCQLCLNRYCDRCFSKVKENAEELRYNLNELSGQNCLSCVVLQCKKIKREHLFLLENKQLAIYLSERRIPTDKCSEKYHLVDLIMEFAEKNGIKSGDDLENEVLHRGHVEELKRKAELLRIQEHRAMEEDMTEHEPGGTSGVPVAEVEDLEQPHFSGSNFDDVPLPDDNDNTNNTGSAEPTSNSTDTGNSAQTENEENTNIEDIASDRVNETPPQNNSNGSSDRPPFLSPRHQASGKWRSMEDIQIEEDINTLTVLELKQILTANFIDYRGCVEKKELRDKVAMLYQSKQAPVGDRDDRDLCKICMDRMIDCIFLDCAHLVSCTKCGKNLTECPICRALIVRVVHIFRA